MALLEEPLFPALHVMTFIMPLGSMSPFVAAIFMSDLLYGTQTVLLRVLVR